MRKWKQGVIASVVFFIALALVAVSGYTENLILGVLSFLVMMFSMIYALGLVVFFIFQMIHGWSRKRWSKLRIEEKVVKTKIVTLYECGNCKTQYSNSQTCPQCGSPYRKTVVEKTEEETVERWKT